MVNKLRLLALLLSALIGLIGAWPSSGKFGGSPYVGPIDIKLNAIAFFGLRAGSKAIALALTPAVTVRRASDNSTQTIAVTVNGNLNTLAANSFAGIDATCVGTAAATMTLSLTGCSSTPTANDTLTSAGGIGALTQPAYIVSCGAFSGGAGSCSLNSVQTVTGVNVTAQVGLFVTQLFDQTGVLVASNAPTSTLAQPTAANQAQLLPSCQNSFPCMLFSGNQYYSLIGNTGNCIAVTAPYFINTVAERTAAFGNTSDIFNMCNGGTNQVSGVGFSVTNTLAVNNQSGTLTATITDLTAHTIQAYSPGIGYFGSPIGNSTVYVDGASTSGSSGTSLYFTGHLMSMGGDGDGSRLMTGYVMEAGLWFDSLITSQAVQLCINDQKYWGLSATCPAATGYANVVAPCDLLVCGEAYSLTRAMTTKYTGALFQIYNGTNFLDIQQTTSTRVADMSTWSAFCSGVQSNCAVSQIYAQINQGANNLGLFVNNSGGCQIAINCPFFTIETATNLPILTTTTFGRYAGYGNDGPIIGVNAGTHDTAVVYNGKLPVPTLAIQQCCGVFGLAHLFSLPNPTGTDFMSAYAYSNTGSIGCGTPNIYCFGIDMEQNGNPSDNLFPSPPLTTPISIAFTVEHGIINGITNSTIMAFNGHTPQVNAPSTFTPLINPGLHFHIGGGGDLSLPDPTLLREGIITNFILTTPQLNTVVSNMTAFYGAVNFP